MIINNKLSAGTRIGSMLLDHIFMSFTGFIFFIPTMIKGFTQAFDPSGQHELNLKNGPLLYIGLLGFSLYFCKDSINGRSLAKRITKMQVTDNITGEAASPLKCLTRNIFCIIWPIEVIATLINPQRRIGDMVAGTKVVFFDGNEAAQPKTDFKKVFIALAVAYGLILLLASAIQQNIFSKKINYVERSYNEKQSRMLEQVFNDSMPQYLSAKVKLYDSIENKPLKYISIIYNLKEDYLSDNSRAKRIREMTEQYLYGHIEKTSFTGQAIYVYKTEHSMHSGTNMIGVEVGK